MNQINILDFQIRTDPAWELLFWISNREHNILVVPPIRKSTSGEPASILKCKIRTPNSLDDFIKSSTF